MAKPKQSTEDKRISRSPNKRLERAIAEDDGSSYAESSDQSHRTRVCYNPGCSDYRRERAGSEDCSCTRTSITSGGN